MAPLPPTASSPAENGAHQQELALGCIEVLGRLSALFVERRKQLAEGVGLTDQQWQVLEEVQQTHFMPSLFAQRRESSAAAVSKILRQLTDKGLITASVSERDARQRQYAITKKGTDIIEALRKERRRAIEQVWLQLSSDELGSFARLGSHIADRLERIANAPRSTFKTEESPSSPRAKPRPPKPRTSRARAHRSSEKD